MDDSVASGMCVAALQAPEGQVINEVHMLLQEAGYANRGIW